MMRIDRRGVLQGGLAICTSLGATWGFTGLPSSTQAADDTLSHGLSTFGDLALPADFKHFPYVNPQAPKGGTLSWQIKVASGNQSFNTFNTFNTFVLRGEGAAGMGLTFDTLMAGSADEPDSAYGLVARAVRISPDQLTYRFLLHPDARFHDGTKITARDVAFSLMILKTKGHPSYAISLRDLVSADAEADDVVRVILAPTRSRQLHLVVAGMPIFSEAYWKIRDFEASTLEAPLASGPYKVGRFEPGRFIEFERAKDYWARDLPVNVGQNNFDRIRYEYFRDRNIAFEGFKSGAFNYHEEYTSRIWATQYDFPALKDGRVKKESLPKRGPQGSQGWYFNTRKPKFADPRVREAIALVFDFEWTNKNIMYGSYRRMTSFFENSEMKAAGKPGPEELALLEPFRGKMPDEVFGEPWLPPVSDGSGNDRALLRKADELLRAAGCKREGNVLRLPDGQPFEIEFLDQTDGLQPHTQPFQANLQRLGIKATSRIVDPTQYQRRLNDFDFDMLSMALGGASTPGDSLRVVYGSKAATTPGSRNMSGLASPAVDMLIETIANAKTRAEVTIAARALDRVLRASRIWVPMWWNADVWIAHWDVFARPDTMPKFDTGAPGTWWYDGERAKRIGL